MFLSVLLAALSLLHEAPEATRRAVVSVDVSGVARSSAAPALTRAETFGTEDLAAPSRTPQSLDALSDALFGRASRTAVAPADSFEDSLARLSLVAPTLSRTQKLYLAARMGATLQAGYDFTYPKGDVPFADLWANARDGGDAGGGCRHIHAYMDVVLERLGFTAVGESSSSSRAAGSDFNGLHDVAHFKDPATGEFWLLDYGTVSNSHRRTLTDAVDVSTRLLAPFTTVSLVSSNAGAGPVHVYPPASSRWVRGLVEQVERPGAALVSLAAARDEDANVLSLAVGPASAAGSLSRLFVVSARTHDATVEATLAGAAATRTAAVVTPWRAFAPATLRLQAEAGLMVFTAVQPVSEARQTDRNVFTGLDALARVPLTRSPRRPLALELHLDGDSFGNRTAAGSRGDIPFVTASVGLAYDRTVAAERGGASTHVRAALVRTSEATATSIPRNTFGFRPRDDRFDVSYGRAGARGAAFELRGQVLALERVGRRAALGLRTTVSGTLPLRGARLRWLVDRSVYVSNPADDPFYEHPPFTRVQLGVERDLALGRSPLTVWLALDRLWGRPDWRFEDADLASPLLHDADENRTLLSAGVRAAF